MACRQLLYSHDVGEFGLAEVAAEAGLPKSSVYHFFPHINDLLAALASEVAGELLAELQEPFSGSFAEWGAVVQAHIKRGRDYYAKSPAALKLQLGPHTPADIKNRDRTNDFAVGGALRALIEAHFDLPDLPDLDGASFRTIEIADLMLMLSVREHGELTDVYVEEAARASIAYLELYLPKRLKRRSNAEP
jgi:AcrR family transcriptional regulator